MASVTFTTQSGQASNRGQSVLVTLNLTDQAKLSSIAEGDLATISGSNNVGYVTNIDTLGCTFQIKPQYPYGTLSSTGNNTILASGTTITVTT